MDFASLENHVTVLPCSSYTRYNVTPPTHTHTFCHSCQGLRVLAREPGDNFPRQLFWSRKTFGTFPGQVFSSQMNLHFHTLDPLRSGVLPSLSLAIFPAQNERFLFNGADHLCSHRCFLHTCTTLNWPRRLSPPNCTCSYYLLFQLQIM